MNLGEYQERFRNTPMGVSAITNYEPPPAANSLALWHYFQAIKEYEKEKNATELQKMWFYVFYVILYYWYLITCQKRKKDALEARQRVKDRLKEEEKRAATVIQPFYANKQN